MLRWRMILRTIVLCWGVLFTVQAIAFEPDSRAANLQPEGGTLLGDVVPQGRLEGPFEFHSEIFSGTVRRYWVFVPGPYDPSEPAAAIT